MPLYKKKNVSIIFWTTQSWSDILGLINGVPASNGVIVMMDAGSYTADAAADLSRVIFIGMVESATAFGGSPTTLTFTSAFTNLGNTLYLINVIALSEVTIWDGVGPFRLNLMGSSDLARSYLGTFVPTIKLTAGGILNVSVSQFSLFAGGSDPTVEMDDGSVINFLLNGAGIIGDKTAVLKAGATAATATMALDSSCVVAGVNGAFGNAFGAGIDSTSNVYKNGNAHFGPFTPTTPSDWNAPAPDDVGAALDSLTRGLVWHKYTVTYTQLSAAALVNDIELFSLPAGALIHNVVIKPQTSFLGGLISAYTLSVGIATNLVKYAAAFNSFNAPDNTVAQLSTVQGVENFSTATSIRVTAVSVTGLLSTATQGSADIWVLVSRLS